MMGFEEKSWVLLLLLLLLVSAGEWRILGDEVILEFFDVGVGFIRFEQEFGSDVLADIGHVEERFEERGESQEFFVVLVIVAVIDDGDAVRDML